MSNPRHQGPQFVPPVLEGMTCLQTVWPGSHHSSIESIAKALGYEIVHHRGSLPWKYVPHEAIGEIFEVIHRGKQDVEASHTIDHNWVSSKLVDAKLEINSVHFANQIGLPVRERDRESYVRLADVRLIVDVVKRAPSSPCRLTTEDVDGFYHHVDEHSLAGLSEAQAARRIAGKPDPMPFRLH
jgi:hypothetical protein